MTNGNGNGKGAPQIIMPTPPQPEARTGPTCATCPHWHKHEAHKGRCMIVPPRMEIVGMAEDMARQKAPVTVACYTITFDEDFCAFHPELIPGYAGALLAGIIPQAKEIWSRAASWNRETGFSGVPSLDMARRFAVNPDDPNTRGIPETEVKREPLPGALRPAPAPALGWRARMARRLEAWFKALRC